MTNNANGIQTEIQIKGQKQLGTLLNISFRDHVITDDVAETSKQPLENMTKHCHVQETEFKVVFIKIFWHSKDKTAGHSER